MARLNRREWAALLAASPLLAQSAATETRPDESTAKPDMAPTSVVYAVESARRTGETLRDLAVPIDLEPAFAFKP